MKSLNYSDAYLKSIGRKIISTNETAKEHKGKWITYEIATDYYHKAQLHIEETGQDIGSRRLLRIEMQEKFGLTEIEAINIINGNHIQEYIDKYAKSQHKSSKKW